jgi:hypothetical protein
MNLRNKKQIRNMLTKDKRTHLLMLDPNRDPFGILEGAGESMDVI